VIGRRRQWTGPPPAGSASLLLVLAVLAGLVGMHGLAAGTPAAGPAHEAHSAAHAPHDGRTAASLCHHHSSGEHTDHSVGDCAATGTVAAHLPPVPGRRPEAPAPCGVRTLRHTSAERAPPDLARLQVLRI